MITSIGIHIQRKIYALSRLVFAVICWLLFFLAGVVIVTFSVTISVILELRHRI